MITTGRYHPTFNDVIITACDTRMFAHVMQVVRKFNVACPIYFNPGDAAVEWKAEIINKLKCTTFYEDDVEQVKILKEKCPKCYIIQV